jgi:protoporphyrinogen oxidase
MFWKDADAMQGSTNGHVTSTGSDQSTLVMGAGPGGLCSAYVLSKAGVPTLVVERAPFVGGLARTIVRDTPYGQFRFDIGGHRWFTKIDELNQLFKEVISEELLWVNRISRIYFDGRYVDYPLKISNALRAVGPVTSAKAVLDYGRTRLQQKIRPFEVVSMEDAYIDQFGPTLYELFFQRYSEKVWGLPCDQMSGDWVSQRSKGMSLVTAIKDAVVPSRGKVVSLIDEFMYPKYGFGRLSERMAEGITRMGNEVRLGAGVTTVHREGNRVTGVTVQTDDGEEFIEATNFISSIPLTVLAKIMEPKAPQEVLDAADKLTFRNIVTVNILLKRRQVTPDTWLYVHDKNILFGRFHEPKNWSPEMVPGDEFTSLVVEYFCSPGDHIWNMTEEEFVKTTVDHLVDDLGFIDRSEVIDGFIIRAPRAYPSYVIGYEEPLETIKDFINQFENLQIIGRYGTFRYNNTDHSIETGLLAAKNILGEHHDLDQVNAEKEYHEIKRVAQAAASR